MSADDGIALRALSVDDYPYVIEHIDEWWGGRPMADMLPRLFFEHFPSTSYAAVDGEGALVGFLCGFISQADASKAYIHFVGVDPTARVHGIGRRLYEAFFAGTAERGCTRVGCVTSPVNVGSIHFHHRMGFSSKVVPGYDGRSGGRVVFTRSLP